MKIGGMLANGKLCYHVLPLEKKPRPAKKKGKVMKHRTPKAGSTTHMNGARCKVVGENRLRGWHRRKPGWAPPGASS